MELLVAAAAADSVAARKVFRDLVRSHSAPPRLNKKRVLFK